MRKREKEKEMERKRKKSRDRKGEGKRNSINHRLCALGKICLVIYSKLRVQLCGTSLVSYSILFLSKDLQNHFAYTDNRLKIVNISE